MKIRTSRKAGFRGRNHDRGAIIGLLAAIAIPNFIRARTTSQMNACIQQSAQIDGAIQQWRLNSARAATPVTVANIHVYLGVLGCVR